MASLSDERSKVQHLDVTIRSSDDTARALTPRAGRVRVRWKEGLSSAASSEQPWRLGVGSWELTIANAVSAPYGLTTDGENACARKRWDGSLPSARATQISDSAAARTRQRVEHVVSIQPLGLIVDAL